MTDRTKLLAAGFRLASSPLRQGGRRPANNVFSHCQAASNDISLSVGKSRNKQCRRRVSRTGSLDDQIPGRPAAHFRAVGRQAASPSLGTAAGAGGVGGRKARLGRLAHFVRMGQPLSLPRQLTGHTTCRRSTISSVGRRGLVRRPLSIPFFTFLRASQPWGSLVLTTLFSRSSVLVMRPDTGHGRLSSIAGTTQCGVEGVETAVPPSHEDQGPTIFCYLEASETPHHQP